MLLAVYHPRSSTGESEKQGGMATLKLGIELEVIDEVRMQNMIV